MNLLNGLNESQREAVTSTAPVIPLCECNCGYPVKPWKHNDRHQGRVKGEFPRFIRGHNARSEDYDGPVFLDEDGYYKFAGRDGKKYLYHRVIMQNVVGRELADEEVVHHENEDKSDPSPGNLKLFANDAEHKRYHFLKERSKLPSGMKCCSSCRTLKPFSGFSKSKSNADGLDYQCKACKKEYHRNVTKKRKAGDCSG